MTLATEEFMRRFLLHVLPSGFHRIRHYGLLANANRKPQIATARQLLRSAGTAAEHRSHRRARRDPWRSTHLRVPTLRCPDAHHRDLRTRAAHPRTADFTVIITASLHPASPSALHPTALTQSPIAHLRNMPVLASANRIIGRLAAPPLHAVPLRSLSPRRCSSLLSTWRALKSP